MKKIIFTIAILFIGSFVFSQESILGTWKTIDDNTGKVRSRVEIYKNAQGKVEGKILELFRSPDEEPDPICDECKKSDPRYGKKVRGMVIITKMKIAQDEKTATSGKILDPENGNVYGCNLSVLEGGKKLKVRGYLGFAALGRTQYWERAN
ncbi:MAG: DUF2147 domain-containing protein [Bacteroidota bacterium]